MWWSMKQDKDFIVYSAKLIILFYNNFNEIDLSTITNDQMKYLKKFSKKLLEEKYSSNNKFINYIKIIKKLIFNLNEYNISTDDEKYVLFMLSIDPNFEALKIYEESNNIKEIKKKMINYFGVYDKNLIEIEKEFIKVFLSDKEKQKLDEEIKKRIFN